MARTGGRAATQPPKQSSLSSLELEAWAGFLRAHASLTRALDEELRHEEGLSLSEYDVLVQLADTPEGRLRMAELADAVLLSRSGLTRLVDGLERRGLVERARCPEDARGLHAVLTPEGLRRRREAASTHLAGVRRDFLDHLREDQLRELADAWETVLSAPGPTDTRRSASAG
jgi:DNA-binding MarR family transcriptional regulator